MRASIRPTTHVTSGSTQGERPRIESAHVRIDETVPWVGWLIVSFVLATLFVLFVPELALWLPRRLGY